MRLRVLGLLASLALALLAVPLAASSLPQRIVLGWNAFGSAASYTAMDARAPGLNTVSPAWWNLRPDASIRDAGDPRFAQWAHARGLRLWPLFGNSIDQATSHRVLTNAGLRSAVIARVTALAAHYGATGVNVDWENLATADRDAFSSFLAQAASAWHRAGLVVSVDVTARTDAWQLGNWSESFDRAALARSADYVVLMAYDEHNKLRPLGPTAGFSWVADSVRFLLRDAPASKVILGVPFYTQDWSSDPKRSMETITYAETPAHLRLHRAVTRWDEAAGQSVATYASNGVVHQMWVEDARSLARKAELVDTYGLAGIAAWRIGFETPDAWRAIQLAPAAAPSPSAASQPAVPATAAPRVVAAPATPVAGAQAPPSRTAAAHSSSRMLFVVAGLAALAVGAAAGAVRLRPWTRRRPA